LRKNDGGFVFVLFLCIIAILVSSNQNSVKKDSEHPMITQEAFAEKQSDVRNVKIFYDLCLDTAYTGAVSYFPYSGAKDFTVSEKILSLHGISALYEVTFDFQRINGENCKLFVNLQYNELQGNNALIKCTEGVFVMSARIFKKGNDEFMILIAPSKKEINLMARAHNLI
jgi:hypothetical protein